jgi:GMP synthase-like glutamine amidotransferase
MRALVIQNCATEGVGLYETYLEQRGIDRTVVHPYDGERFPAPQDYHAFFVTGTPIAAYEVHLHPFLQREWRFLKKVVEADKPCLGICFGGQLLARLLGARVHRHSSMELGGSAVRLTTHGRKDPVLAGFPETFPVFQWHGDTFEVPAGARLLAEGDPCRNQLFRRGNAVAIQFHLEVTSAEASRWAIAYIDEVKKLGKTRAQIVEECESREPAMRELAWRLMDNLLALR